MCKLEKIDQRLSLDTFFLREKTAIKKTTWILTAIYKQIKYLLTSIFNNLK